MTWSLIRWCQGKLRTMMFKLTYMVTMRLPMETYMMALPLGHMTYMVTMRLVLPLGLMTYMATMRLVLPMELLAYMVLLSVPEWSLCHQVTMPSRKHWNPGKLSTRICRAWHDWGIVGANWRVDVGLLWFYLGWVWAKQSCYNFEDLLLTWCSDTLPRSRRRRARPRRSQLPRIDGCSHGSWCTSLLFWNF